MEICDKCGGMIKNRQEQVVFEFDEDSKYFHTECYEKVRKKAFEDLE